MNNNGWFGGGWSWWGGCFGAAFVVGVATHVYRRRRQASVGAAAEPQAAAAAPPQVELAQFEGNASQLRVSDIAALYAAADANATGLSASRPSIREIETAYANIPAGNVELNISSADN